MGTGYENTGVVFIEPQPTYCMGEKRMTICQQYSLLTLAVLLVTVFGYGPPVIAAEFQATVQVSSEYRSNVRLDPDIEIDDTENTAILELSLNQR